MDLSVGVLMTQWRGARVAAILVLIVVWSGCGDTFRPVAVPIPPPPPDPKSFHFVLVISENGPNNAGASTRIDVSECYFRDHNESAPGLRSHFYAYDGERDSLRGQSRQQY